MTCLPIHELERLVDGSVDADGERLMSEHLSSCRACRDLLAEVRSNFEVLVPVRRALTAVRDAAPQRVPESIGPYRVVREIGRGGMGVVYEGRQLSPARRVAIKLLHAVGAYGDDEYGRRLLQREAQALARVRHPFIAGIHDAGVSEDGCPYLVMELVDGRTLLSYARERELSLRSKLELFRDICDAVAAVHRHGVIHRDLKPSNVLVEADGTPRVLDFGMAKLVERNDGLAETGDERVVTAAGRIVGTVPYMSPEQARGAVHELDVRSDVYSLGVVLFELLTGRLPYDLDPTNLPEAARIIAEVPPIKPSRLSPALRGEIETIVLKALEKDPDRRYAGATSLREDLDHLLRGEPILARRPTLVYHARKLVSRHRLPFALAGAMLLVLLAYAVTTSVLVVRLAEERATALAARDDEATARREAERQRTVAEAVNAFLIDTLGAADPWQELPGGPSAAAERSIVDALNRAAHVVATQAPFRDAPEVEAAVRHAIGDTYRSLGRHSEAERMLRDALELRRRLGPAAAADVAQTLNKLARVRESQGDLDEAEALYVEALDLRERLFGDSHPETATILNNLGWLLHVKGRLDEAEGLLGRALVIRQERLEHPHSETATTINNLALVHVARRDYPRAESMLHEALAIDRAARGAQPGDVEHPNIVGTVNNIAVVMLRQGRVDEALPLLEETLAARQRQLGEHPLTAQSLASLARALRDAGRFAEALHLAEQAGEMCQSVYREPHRDTAVVHWLVATLHDDLGTPDAADPWFDDAIEMMRAILGEDHADVKALVGRVEARRQIGDGE